MKRASAMIMILMVLVLVASVAEAGTNRFYIGPFDKGDPFLDRPAKTQLLEGMKDVPEGAELIVKGYACSVGPRDFNERLAEWRAQQTSKEIKKINPGRQIKIKAIPWREDGDINHRVVAVVYEAEKAPPGVDVSGLEARFRERLETLGQGVKERIDSGFKSLEEKVEEMDTGSFLASLGRSLSQDINRISARVELLTWGLLLLVVLSLISIILSLAVLFLMFRVLKKIKLPLGGSEVEKVEKEAEEKEEKKPSEPEGEEEKDDSSSEVKEKTKEEGMWLDHGPYSVWIEKKDSCFILPFKNKKGVQIFRSSENNLRDALRKGFRKYSDQVEGLKNSGLIKDKQ